MLLWLYTLLAEFNGIFRLNATSRKERSVTNSFFVFFLNYFQNVFEEMGKILEFERIGYEYEFYLLEYH